LKIDCLFNTSLKERVAGLEDRSYFGPSQTPARLFILCNLSITCL